MKETPKSIKPAIPIGGDSLFRVGPISLDIYEPDVQPHVAKLHVTKAISQ
jgi:hypothetical protein